MLSISLVTLGDPEQLTGGYLYHRRMADGAADYDARISFVSFPAGPFPTPVLSGGRVLREAGQADVVLVDSIAAAFLGPWLAARRPALPVAAIVHQPPGGIDHGPLRARPQAVLDELTYRRSRRIVAASRALADDYVARGFAADRVVVVPPGRDVAPVPTGPRPDLRAGRRVALLCVGNWVERKGILPLLEAVDRLPDGAATLHLVGRDDVDPGYGRRVRERLAGTGGSGRVVVHGPVGRERVAQLYAAADVFVLPSTREPYGTVYGEAMAAGLPVVGWRSGNLPHLADHDREGVVLEPGDVAGLAAALGRLADDPGYRRQLAEGARRRAQALPTWADSARQLFDVLRDVAG